MPERGGLAQRLLGFGACNDLRLIDVAAIVGLVHIVDLKQRRGIVLRAELAPYLDRFGTLARRHQRAPENVLQIHIVGVAGHGLAADLDPMFVDLLVPVPGNLIGRRGIDAQAFLGGRALRRRLSRARRRGRYHYENREAKREKTSHQIAPLGV